MDPLPFDGSVVRGLASVPARSYSEAVASNVLLSVWRRRGFVLCCVLMSLGAAAAVLTILPKSYHAEAMVQLDFARHDSDVTPGQASSLMLDATAVVQSEAVVLRSRMIARRVVARLGLANEKREPVWSAWTAATIWLRHTFLPRPSKEDVVNPITPADEAERDLMSRLTVSTDNRSYLITIGYTASTPEAAARIANAVANEYLQRRAEAKLDIDTHRAQWLEAQIVASKKELSEAEDAVAAYRAKTGQLEIGPNGASVGEEQLRGLTTQANDATLARIAAETRLARVRELTRTGTVLATSDLQGLPAIQSLIERQATARKQVVELLTRFGPHHPNVIQAQASLASATAALSAEVNHAVSAIQAEVEASRRVEQTLKDRLERLKQQVIAARVSRTTLRNFEDQAQAIRDRLVSLNRSHQDVVASRALGNVAASLVVPADPVHYPSSPRTAMVLGVGLIAGVGIGVAGAMMLERQDHGLRSSTEVAANPDIRCLGMVPELSRKALAERGTPANTRSRKRMLEQTLFDEAVRMVGAGIRLFDGAQESRVVLVTSVAPGEGKSLFCHALAEAAVTAGHRVLLIHSPPTRWHQADPDIADATVEADSPVHEGAGPLVVQRKAVVATASNIFDAGRLNRLLEEARKHFDIILMEAPPVMLVADTLILGHHADASILLARWGATRRASVEATLARLHENSLFVDGLVLTRVNLGRHARLHFLDQCSYYRSEQRFYEQLFPSKAGLDSAAHA